MAKLSAPWGFQVWWSQWHKFQSCMMICFWESTFWAKASFFFVFRGPNWVHPEIFSHANCNGTSFKPVWWTTFLWGKTFRGPNSVHSEVFRSDDHNGTSFKAVWWSISEKTHFGLKHHFPLYLEYQIQFWGFQVWWLMVQVSKLYNDPFLKKTLLG